MPTDHHASIHRPEQSQSRSAILCAMLALALMGTNLGFASEPQTRIIGGSDAASDAFPWAAALVYHSDPDALSGQACGGALIHPSWVLTAAHCFADDSGRIVSSPDLDVIIGRLNLTTDEGVRMTPDRMVAHPQWAPDSWLWNLPTRNDLLLLHLPEPITWTSPLPLPGPTFDTNYAVTGETSYAVGWGVTTPWGWNASSALRYVGLPIVSQSTCQAAQPSFPVLDTTVCAGPQDGEQDTCYGDSGGPLVVARGGSSDWVQVGITSYGQSGCAEPGKYGVYTRVSRYAQWISDTACTDEERPARPTLQLMVEGQTATAWFAPVAGATGYRLYYAPAPGMAPIDQIDLGPWTGFSAELAPGSDLFVAVQAYNGICLSPYSEIQRLTIP